jgi:hypothetical protein
MTQSIDDNSAVSWWDEDIVLSKIDVFRCAEDMYFFQRPTPTILCSKKKNPWV